MSKRITHSPEFKARDAMEAISGLKKIQEIAAYHAIQPPSQPVEAAAARWSQPTFHQVKQSKDKRDGQANKAELFQ
jgi:hypothetical protein